MYAMSEFGNSRLSTTGGWLLGAGRVLRLRLREQRYLRATQGSLWVTFDALSPQSAAGGSGDHILVAGERLLVPAGRTVVLSVGGARSSGAAFDWQLVPQPARAEWRPAVVRWLAGFGLASAGLAG